MAQEGLVGRVEYFGFHGLGIGRAVADAEVVEEDEETLGRRGAAAREARNWRRFIGG